MLRLMRLLGINREIPKQSDQEHPGASAGVRAPNKVIRNCRVLAGATRAAQDLKICHG